MIFLHGESIPVSRQNRMELGFREILARCARIGEIVC